MILAHGIGSRHDLPLPLDLVLQGAAVALLVSFLGLGLLWTKPRFLGAAAGRPVTGQVRRLVEVSRPAIRIALLAFTVFVMTVAVAGPADERNPAPHVLYVLFWVGLAVASVLFGPVWRMISPLRLIHRLALPRRALLEYPARLGYWPAAAGLFAFTWLELAAPDRSAPRTVALFLGCYVLVQLAGAGVFGERWFDSADPFEVYSTLLGHLGPFGRREDGALVLRNPFDGLAALPVRPGLVAVVAVCLGSTAFDSFGATPSWARLVQSSGLPASLAATAGLTVSVLLVAGSYVIATALAGRTIHGSRTALAGQLAHSLVPIVAGYVIAHYYSLLVVEGQRALILLSDPFGTGANLLGLSGSVPAETAAAPGIVAAIQVIAVLIGHLVGVVAAHDSSLRLLPARQQLAGQAPLLLLMVGYTAGGLALLFAG